MTIRVMANTAVIGYGRFQEFVRQSSSSVQVVVRLRILVDGKTFKACFNLLTFSPILLYRIEWIFKGGIADFFSLESKTD